MSFTVNDVMERVNNAEPGRVIAYIKDYFAFMAKRNKIDHRVYKQDIIEGALRYVLPSDIIRLFSVSTLYTSNSSELLAADDQTITTSTNWTNTDFSSFAVSSGVLAVTANAANQSCYLNDDGITEGLQYNLRYDATLSSGTFRLATYIGGYTLGTFEAGTNNVMTFTAPESSKLKLLCISDSGEASFDNFSLKQANQDKYKQIGYLKGSLPADYFDDEIT